MWPLDEAMYTVVTFIVIVKISSLWSSDQSPVIFISSHDFSSDDFRIYSSFLVQFGSNDFIYVEAVLYYVL